MSTAVKSVTEGLFESDADGAHLIGSRCRSCGALHFPIGVACANPACDDKTVERVALPTRGTLYSFTIQRYQPPPMFRMDDWQPYAIGLVDLGEGLRVMGMLTGIAPEAVAIGMPVHLVVEPLYTDDGGTPVLTYKFAPDGDAAR